MPCPAGGDRVLLLPTFLIGLREGLEAALVVGILVAYPHAHRPSRRAAAAVGRRRARRRCSRSVIGAVLTFGAYTLTFEAQEIIGGTLSLVAVAMVTWMIFWMQQTARTPAARASRADIDRALAPGGCGRSSPSASSRWRARASRPRCCCGRWCSRSATRRPRSWARCSASSPRSSSAGCSRAGCCASTCAVFFTWTGAFLIIVAAGVLAYGVHDLQEAGVLPGPFTAPPRSIPTPAPSPSAWRASRSAGRSSSAQVLRPDSIAGRGPQATVGFMPQMSWLQVIAWAAYLAIVGTIFLRRARGVPATRPSLVVDPDTDLPHPLRRR